MLTESELQILQMAVNQFGGDRTRLEDAKQALRELRLRRESVPILDVLQGYAVLTPEQAAQLRRALDRTHFDFNTATADQEHKRKRSGFPLAAPMAPAPELKQLDKFRLLRRLGYGGMGSVYLAYDPDRRGHVALKVLSPENADVPAYFDRFLREGKNGMLLEHPSIVRNYDVRCDDVTGLHFLVLEYVDGPNGLELLDRFQRLDIGDAVHIILDIARALEYAHGELVIHRDIKPSNILLTSTGIAKLADLGLAKKTDEDPSLTNVREGVGTPHYVPYEQAVSARNADARSDLYALGATLYHFVTGEVPFPGSNALEVVDRKSAGTFLAASEINRDVPPALDAIIARLMARNPDDRYQTAAELIADLDATGLATPVLSFVDLDLALHDPLVRKQLAGPLLDTLPVLLVDDLTASAAGPAQWYIRYTDIRGKRRKTKITLTRLLQRMHDRRLPADAQVSRYSKEGYKPVREIPELRQALKALRGKLKATDVGRTPTPPPALSSWVISLALFAGASTLLAWAVAWSV